MAVRARLGAWVFGLWVLGLLAAPSVGRADGRVVLAIEGEALLGHLEGELRVRGIEPVPDAPDATGDARVWLEGDVAVVSTPHGTTRLTIDLADPFTSGLAIAALVEEALLPAPVPEAEPAPQRERAVRMYFDAEVGAYLGTDNLLGHGYVRHAIGAEWREGARVGVLVDLYGYGFGAVLTGVSGSFGIEVAGRFSFDLVALHVGAHALLASGRPRGQLDVTMGLGGLFGGDVGVALVLDPHVELGLRLGADALVEEGEAASAVLRAGVRVEWR